MRRSSRCHGLLAGAAQNLSYRARGWCEGVENTEELTAIPMRGVSASITARRGREPRRGGRQLRRGCGKRRCGCGLMRRSGVAASSCLCGLDEGANETTSARVGSEHAVDSRGRGCTAQLTLSIGPRSTGLHRRFARRRGDRL